MEPAEAIREIVDRETRAWDTQDVELLLSIFHPDMVWVWPRDEHAHDPIHWVTRLGRFDADRWGSVYRALFDEHELVHNRREVIKIDVSREGDGGFAVVDIDTRWRPRAGGEDDHWLGRTCKTYVLVAGGWKMIAQTGVLDYSVVSTG
jgi:ketosteroid isomerase-like protein